MFLNQSLLQHMPKGGVRCADSCVLFISAWKVFLTYWLIHFHSCIAGANILYVVWASSDISHPFLFVSLFKLVLSGAGCVWASLPARLPANAPHWHVSVCVNHRCLISPPLWPPPDLPWLSLCLPARSEPQHRWHKAAWLACHTSIRLWEAAGESKMS